MGYQTDAVDGRVRVDADRSARYTTRSIGPRTLNSLNRPPRERSGPAVVRDETARELSLPNRSDASRHELGIRGRRIQCIESAGGQHGRAASKKRFPVPQFQTARLQPTRRTD